MRFAGVHTALPMGGATALLAALAWGAAGRWEDFPQSLPWWITVTGGWMTAASTLGPLCWWPSPWLTIAWALIALAARRAAHGHRSVTAARVWREAREDWLGRSHDWGLGGSHLLELEHTPVGELYTVSTKGTRKRASRFIGSSLEETIAEAEDLPLSRVEVRGHGLAGRIVISVRRASPWAGAVLHPVVCDDPEGVLPAGRTIRVPVLVGEDRETGDLLSLPLWDKAGAKNVSITGMAGAGKTILLDDISEWVTASPDAMMARINLSDKGYGEIESWGPSCHLTAFGPDGKGRAADVLQVLAGVIAWRSRAYKRGQYKPSPADPLIVLIVDESDETAAVPAVKSGLDKIATKARELGIAFVHAGQRGTHDYGSAKQRSQDTVRCVGAVNRQGETRHAAGSMASSVPDMASYGEGQPGVWSITVNGASVRNGRTWVFSDDEAEHGAEVEAIAQERAFDQPELPAACREFLGEQYEQLLRTEVFARWARASGYGDPEAEADGETDEDAGVPAAMPPLPGPGGGTEAAAAAAGGSVLTEEDPLRRWETDMNDRERERFDALAAKLGGARRLITQTMARPAPPEVSPEVLAAQAAERWWQVGEATEIPEGARPRLTEMLAAGTTISRVAKELAVTKWIARQWLQKLRNEGIAYVDGTRATARWRLAPPPEAGDAPSPLKD
jgi:hypothetical protein